MNFDIEKKGTFPDEEMPTYLYRVKLLWDVPGSYGSALEAVVAESAMKAVEMVAGDHIGQLTYCHVTAMAPDSYGLIKKMHDDFQSRYAYTGIKNEITGG